MNSNFFDALETRSSDERDQDNLIKLKKLIEKAKNNPLHKKRILAPIQSLLDIKNIEILRKSDLTKKQIDNPPFANLNIEPLNNFAHIYRSPGPIYDLDGNKENWWRFARALHAANFKKGDIVQNCFSYHFTPAGLMFEEAARILKCTVFPAGGENSDAQIEVMSQVNTTAYVGVPDFLRILLEKADQNKIDLPYLKKAMFSGGPLFPNVADYFKSKDLNFFQCYGTADLGLIAYEASEKDGMVIDENVILEIVTPGTGDPVPEGEVGEVIVTVLDNYELPMIRFATGDLSSFLHGTSSSGRTNKRIKGWQGRADQTTKVRGMFVQPSQINLILKNCFKINVKSRLIVSRENDRDNIHLKIESNLFNSLEKNNLEKKIVEEMKNIFNLRGSSELVEPKSLPNDGKIIDDIRDFGDKQ
tara:strand:- start:748 stop:1998 length:1251 start_codon:yes stop_codon:yes gene_type:complete